MTPHGILLEYEVVRILEQRPDEAYFENPDFDEEVELFLAGDDLGCVSDER